MEGYHLNKTGERVSELLSRQFIVPTFNSPPTEQTKNWIDGQYLVDFRIGEMCRVKVNNTFVFYRLQDISDGKYVWINDDVSEMPDMSNYYTKEETDIKINEKIENIEFPQDESIKQLTQQEYDSLNEYGLISDKTLYLILENGEPVGMFIGNFQIATKDLGSKGFPYSFPVIF